MKASISGLYTILYESATNLFGCLYDHHLMPSDSHLNSLDIDDTNCTATKFQFTKHLTANQPTILVLSTLNGTETALFNATVFGPAQVMLTPYVLAPLNITTVPTTASRK
jgi:hypothetical protein